MIPTPAIITTYDDYSRLSKEYGRALRVYEDDPCPETLKPRSAQGFVKPPCTSQGRYSRGLLAHSPAYNRKSPDNGRC